MIQLIVQIRLKLAVILYFLFVVSLFCWLLDYYYTTKLFVKEKCVDAVIYYNWLLGHFIQWPINHGAP